MNALLYIGSAIIILWGIAHLVPTRGVVTGFGDISKDNKRIITMEWLAEGLVMIFIGVLVVLVTPQAASGNGAARVVVASSAVMLLVIAVLTQMTGARTSIIPIKICPWVKTLVAVLFFLFIIGSGS
jgi:hypothetical protein